MKSIVLIGCLFSLACTAQETRQVGGPCEGCEALFEFQGPQLLSIDTIPGFHEFDPKMKVEGTIFESDGKTPADGVILYLYQTDREGIYNPPKGARGWAQRHGQHRGWIKTGKDGKYVFYTFRPGAYPNRNIPEHIHLTVKEEDTIPYFIDDIMFKDDPLLSRNEIASRPNRAGSGIVLPQMKDSILIVKRDIYLGRNIPGY